MTARGAATGPEASGQLPNRVLAGVGYCLLATLAFASQDTIVKHLSTIYPVLEVITARTAFVVVILAAAGLQVRGAKVLEATRVGPMLLRGFMAFVAFSTYYVALTRMPLSDGAAIYMTAPLFVTVWSVLLLGERVRWQQWAAILTGFGATIYMLNPGSEVFEWGAALPIVSALAYASIPILTRRFGVHEHPLTMGLYSIVSYFACCLAIGAVVHAAPDPGADAWLSVRAHWEVMAARDVALAGLASALFTVGLVCITQAYRVAAASVVAPFEYSYLVWATLLGLALFLEVPGPRTMVGGMVIVVCGCYLMMFEKDE